MTPGPPSEKGRKQEPMATLAKVFSVLISNLPRLAR